MRKPFPPKQIGHFRVEGVLGRGGMGIVYGAWDTELNRAVALKALPPELAARPGRSALLTAEAQALAALNHPHIATIHGLVQDGDGARYLVLERLGGELLSARLARGPIPILESLEVCAAIAAALEAAHAKGILHRDLKPSNVMLTATGPKVLDFGLARAGREELECDPSDASTWTGSLAAAGTVGYASPEQTLGQPHDRRTDLFSWGCVLYECLAGRRAFSGETQAKARMSVLVADPEWHSLPDATPEGVRRLLDRCLRKEPARRQRDVGDARLVLEEAIEALRGGAGAAREKHPVVPAPLTTFIGRAREMEECARFLESCRLLTLTGAGGSGKTRLALALAHSHDEVPEGRGAFPDGITFVDLAPLADPARVPQAILAAAGIREDAGRPGAEALADAWRQSRALLILDNCEHLVEAVADFAATVLSRTRALRLLATSREPLQVTGEQVFPVSPLPVSSPAARCRPGVQPSDAALLFADRARMACPSFALTSANCAAVEEICAALDGLPLAVELAAARAHVLSLEQIRASLHDRLGFLTAAGRAAGRHRTYRAVVDWSYDLLTHEERRLFQRLSVMSGGFTLEAAEAVHAADTGGARAEEAGAEEGAETVELLRRLVDKSLVSAPRPQDAARGLRFRILETLRSYAAERLADAGGLTAARDAHLRHFLSVAEQATPELTGPSQASCLDRLEADHENFLAALSWCDRREGVREEGLRLAASLWRFWLARGYLSLGRAMLGMTLRRAAPERSARGDSPGRGAVLMGLGALAFHQNDWDSADAAYREALGVMERLGREADVGHALVGLGNVAMGRSDYGSADSSYARALTCFERAGHERGKALVASNRGRVAELTEDFVRARTLYEEGIERFQRIGDGASLAVRLSSLAELCLRLGDAEACRGRLSECFAVVRSLDERRAGAYALERTAMLAEHLGDPAAALRWCGAASALRLRIASPPTPAEEGRIAAVVSRARDAMGPGSDAAWEEGRALAFPDATAGAERWLAAATRAAADAPSPAAGTERARSAATHAP